MRRLAMPFLVLMLSACASQQLYSPQQLSDANISSDARETLAPYFAAAQKGSTSAHFYLGMTFCGELCLTPKAGDPEAQKAALSTHLADVRHMNITPDYVRAYAHFLLADDATTSEVRYRDLLEEKMTMNQISAANASAAMWKVAAVDNKPAPKKRKKSVKKAS